MAVDLVALRAKFIALIKDNKTHDVIVLKPVNQAPADPNLPHRVTGSPPTQYPCAAIVSDVAVEQGPAEKNCIVPGDLGIEPDESMRVRFADLREYSIKNSLVWDQGGVAIGYKLRLQAWPTSSPAQT